VLDIVGSSTEKASGL